MQNNQVHRDQLFSHVTSTTLYCTTTLCMATGGIQDHTLAIRSPQGSSKFTFILVNMGLEFSVVISKYNETSFLFEKWPFFKLDFIDFILPFHWVIGSVFSIISRPTNFFVTACVIKKYSYVCFYHSAEEWKPQRGGCCSNLYIL